MEKAKMCSDHFVLNCKLCSGDAPSATPAVSKVIPFTTPVPTETVGLPAGGDYIQLSAVNIAKQAVPVRSAEAQNVMTVADEYARACESYSEAQAAVAAMMVHIAKMTEVLTNLQNSVVTTRQEKDEAKRRVFDSMKEGA